MKKRGLFFIFPPKPFEFTDGVVTPGELVGHLDGERYIVKRAQSFRERGAARLALSGIR